MLKLHLDSILHSLLVALMLLLMTKPEPMNLGESAQGAVDAKVRQIHDTRGSEVNACGQMLNR